MSYHGKNEIAIEELKRLELKMLDDVVDFCNHNDLEYFLVGGTLLGSIRHKGFIPWDDDIDIAMPRKSYEYFISNFKSEMNHTVVSIHNMKKYYLPWAKVINKDTVLFEEVHKPIELGVYIDIFPIDTYRNEREAENVFERLKPLRRFLDYKQIPIRTDKKRSAIGQVKILLIHVVSFPFTRNSIAKKIDFICRSKAVEQGTCMANMVAMYYGIKEIVETDAILPVDAKGLFEGKYYKIPHSSDILLTHLYGDYMQLPPVEKRVTHHGFHAYWKD